MGSAGAAPPECAQVVCNALGINSCPEPMNRLPLAFILLSSLASAQELPATKPEAVGLSSERLERISTAVQKSIDDKRLAGAVTMSSVGATSPGSRRKA